MQLLRQLVFFLFLLSNINCQKKRPLQLDSTLKPAQTTRITPFANNRLYFVAQIEDAKVDSDELRVYQVNASELRVEGSSFSRLQFFADAETDFVRWMACPVYGEEECLQGRSQINEVFLGIKPKGTYTISVRACVRADRSVFAQEGCGPVSAVNFAKTFKLADEKADLIEEYHVELSKLSELGLRYHAVMKDLNADLGTCTQLAADSHQDFNKDQQRERELTDILQIQLQNIENMGVGFSIKATHVVDAEDLDSSELASVVGAEPDELAIDAPIYVPDGLSLAEDRGGQINQYLSKGPIPELRSGRIYLGEKDLSSVLRGSLGVGQSALQLAKKKEDSAKKEKKNAVVSDWEGLADWQKGTSLASLILSGFGGLLGQEIANDFAASRLFAAVTSIKRDKYSCFAMNKAAGRFEGLNERLKFIRQRIEELAEKIELAEAP